MNCESYKTLKVRKLGVSNLAKQDKYSGKPYEGKPHVRFDEGSRETGSRVGTAPLSYSTVKNK